MKKLFSNMPDFQIHYHLKLNFQKWTNVQEAIDYPRGTKHRKDNQS